MVAKSFPFAVPYNFLLQSLKNACTGPTKITKKFKIVLSNFFSILTVKTTAR